MGEVPTEIGYRSNASIPESETANSYLRQYDIFIETTTQMLATPKLHERLLLALEAINNAFGYHQSIIAIVNENAGDLRVRATVGFDGDQAAARIEMPLDSSAACVRVIHDACPLWIDIDEDESSRALFSGIAWQQHDVLAFPLFGIPEMSGRRDVPTSSRLGEHFWTFEPGSRLGVLYIGANRESMDPTALHLIKRFSDRIGVVASLAIQQERLVNTVTKLQRERQWTESIMKSVANPIVLTDLDNEILLQNRRAEELFSGSANAGEGKRRALKMNDLLFSAYLSSATVSSQEVIQRDITLVDPIEGSDIHFEVISTPAANARGEPLGLVSIFRDVTDLREANEELARNFGKLQQAEAESSRERDRLDLIIENVGHPIVVCDALGNFILFNRRAELLFQETKTSSTRATAAVRTNAVKLTSFISGLASGAETGRQAEIELIDPDSGRTLPMEITAREVLDMGGMVTAVVSILHDLTEIRELERRRVEQQLFESEKLAAVGRLAASIAHEVNNPLEAIKNALYLMQSGSEDNTNDRFLEIARKETERVSHIIRQMLGFARRPGAVDWVNVNQLIEETVVLLEKKMRQLRIRLTVELESSLPMVRARQDQLRQVFLNLLINAQQAIGSEGQIVITTSRYEQALQPTIVIQVSDSGVGIPEDDLSRIFEPFFSTGKKGTGLGLWVTQGIVRQHSGRIEVSSEIGRGTVFSIFLQVDSPVLDDQDKEGTLGGEMNSVPDIYNDALNREADFESGEGRLLVVDDEESLRITTAAILEKEGYSVDTAASGDEAIQLLERIDYDLVLTDLHMEGGDGLAVINQIRRHAPLTIAIVLTGFASVESAIAALQEGAYDYLVKPCDIDHMKHTIRRGVEHRRLMLAEQKARTDLEQLNRDLEKRIEERTAELRQLNEDLAEANRAKDVFLATLSHELRTPLTPVVGWIKLLRSGNLDSKGVTQALDAIERNAWLQSRLIDDLLDTSRIATGKLHFEPQPTDLNVIVRGAVDTVRASAASRNIDLDVNLSPETLVVMGEPVRLQQIVWNLISNAIKFTDVGGRVEVSTEPYGSNAILSVKDSGIGIAPEFLPHVFDRFRQADGSTSRLHGGLGLGLAIAHALAKMHGGKLAAKSDGVGHGALFTLEMGLASNENVVEEISEEKSHSFTGLDVLIVEDSPDTLTLLSKIFCNEGANVTTAKSANEAFHRMAVKRPNIIISDIGMPDTDGYEFMEQVRVMPGMDDIPAIAISGYASDEDRARAIGVGYLALVAKPIDVEALFNLIQQLNLH